MGASHFCIYNFFFSILFLLKEYSKHWKERKERSQYMHNQNKIYFVRM